MLGSVEMRYSLIFGAIFWKLWPESSELQYDQTLWQVVFVCFGSWYLM